MVLYKYAVIMKHDTGKISIRVLAFNKQNARELVMKAESAPDSAVVSVKRI